MELVFENYDYLAQACLLRKTSLWETLSTFVPDITPCLTPYPWSGWDGIAILVVLVGLFLVVKFVPTLPEKVLRLRVSVAIKRFQPKDILTQVLNTPSWTAFFIIATGSLSAYLAINGYFVSHSACNFEHQSNNAAAIIAAATAILFPFIILLLGKDSQISSSGLSTPEVLLRYCSDLSHWYRPFKPIRSRCDLLSHR